MVWLKWSCSGTVIMFLSAFFSCNLRFFSPKRTESVKWRRKKWDSSIIGFYQWFSWQMQSANGNEKKEISGKKEKVNISLPNLDYFRTFACYSTKTYILIEKYFFHRKKRIFVKQHENVRKPNVFAENRQFSTEIKTRNRILMRAISHSQMNPNYFKTIFQSKMTVLSLSCWSSSESFIIVKKVVCMHFSHRQIRTLNMNSEQWTVSSEQHA